MNHVYRVKSLRTIFAAAVLAVAGSASAATTVNLTAQRATAAMPDGTAVPMWQFCGGLDATQTNAGTATGGACGASWTPAPTIVVPIGDSLTINLTNKLNVPTSIVVLGQLGGGLGQGTRMASPAHNGQSYTTFPGNGQVDPGGGFTPPAQGTRVQSMGSEAAPGKSVTLTWTGLKAGTYLYETGTLPSLEAPMGLYGVIVVTSAPVPADAAQSTSFAAGTAYPATGKQAAVAYDADATLLFSEIDPAQNAQVDVAERAGTDITKNLRFDDSTCVSAGTAGRNVCFPAAVNYTPQYFLINGQPFDRTQPGASVLNVGADAASGNVLVRMVNAGLRTHVPVIPGLPFSLVAEDGNRAPGNPKVQSEALLTAGKTYDVIVKPTAAAGRYAAATFSLFDRQGSLSNANYRDGGMQGFLIVNGNTYAANGTALTGGIGPGQPGALPTIASGTAVDDAFAMAADATSYAGNVRTNDVGVNTVALVSQAVHGTVSLGANGSFLYVRTDPAYTGTDTFTYSGNGGATNTATVTLTIGSAQGAPTAVNDSFQSNVASVFHAPSPGVLANDSDPAQLPLTVDVASVANTDCGSVDIGADGAFTVTAGSKSSCSFTYAIKNSQGVAGKAAAKVTVAFATGTGLALKVLDATTGAALGDYRWVIQEDLTFKSLSASTPSVNTRTLGTSFHRSHNPVVASGCVGPISCGSGQQVRGVAVAAGASSSVADVALDPNKHYFVSVLPGDAANPVVNGGGGPVDTGRKDAQGNPIMRQFDVALDCSPKANDATDPCGHMMGGTAVGPTEIAARLATIRLQKTPINPAQLSIYIYEDNAPTNGQTDFNEQGLGGFNIILVDAVGRSGDPAGQQTYDAFNMPLTNALLGTPGCPNELNATSTAAAGNDIVGMVYTCPNAPPGYRGPASDYALAGHALIRNVTPARYDVIAHPGAAREGRGEVWIQTETLEGTPAQDAFTGVNEPRYFQEFGPPGFHTTIGFVNPQRVKDYAVANKLVGKYSITGQVTNQHMSRPSNVTLYDSGAYDLLNSTNCQVALNSQGGTGPTIGYATCAPDGTFTLTGVPPGSYLVAIWDQWLDQIFQTVAVTVTNADVDMGSVPVLSWFTQHDQNQLLDDGTGNLKGIPNVLMTVRYRNGSISNQTLTDVNGNGILVELFPLFNWYVSESDTTRYKQKRVDVTVDGGGAVDTTGAGAGLWASKYPTGESTARSETPGAYSYGIQGFISQRNQINWIKSPYASGENGGIQGVVVYSSTRAFDDQRFNVQTIWEPLVPRVTVNLYQRVKNADGTTKLTVVDTTKTTSFDDWVNTVYGADGRPYVLGPDQVLRDPATGAAAPSAAYPAGKQVNLQCPGQLPGPPAGAVPPFDTTQVDPFTTFTLGNDQFRCYDGFHNWNQIQAAPYDGRYQFPSDAYVKAHPLTADQVSAGQTLVSLPPGDYVVEAVTPPGYQIVKEEDKNILIGDAFIAPVTQQFGGLGSIFILPDQATLNNANRNNPNTGDPGFQSDPTTNLGASTTSIAFPECLGALHRVPDYLSLYPQAQQVAPFAGMDRPLCDKKLVKLGDQMQVGANFFLFTGVPVAANATGIILDDASAEFNAYSPDFGEKASVPFVPVSTKDWAGAEVSRVYSDQWGAYNLMLPSSWLVNPPTPSGYGPNMLVNCINDPGPIPATDAAGRWIDAAGNVVADPALAKQITDPAYNPAYSNFCYTNPFMPGQATYLDTPVLPIAAFAAGYNPADCAYPDATPAIARVDSSAGAGPWLPKSGGTLTVKALGFNGTTDVGVDVPNPGYAGPFALSGPSSQRTITRHYGFGSRGPRSKVTLGGATLAIASWTPDSITVNVPAGTPSGQLAIIANNGKSSVDAITVTVEDLTPVRVSGATGGRIQDAIDNAKPGDLILVDAGTYNELVVMWKPVRLQGVGAASVIVNAAKYPTSKLEAWRPRINALFGIDINTGNAATSAQVDPLPGQEITGGVVLLEPSVLGTEEGAGITVVAKGFKADGVTPLTNSNADCAYRSTNISLDLANGANTRPDPGLSNFRCAPSRIDGLSVTGGDAGGGVYVNGWAHNLEIANNRIFGNAGAFHGGVRIGVPYLEIDGYPGQAENADGDLGGRIKTGAGGVIAGLGYDIGVRVHHNMITKNGVVEGTQGQGGAGGGVSICTGTDGYSVDHNWVCGNYSQSDGGGIGHLGFSQGGTIAFNQILFNQSFQQTASTHGGGIFVGGEPATGLQTQSLGTGNLSIDANVIRGNFAEAGHGGGIRLQQVNGADIQNFPNSQGSWNKVTVTNNIIDNNVAGWAGGGISLADTLASVIDNNTIASNDSVGIAGVLQSGASSPLVAQPVATGKPNPAGISSDPTSATLAGVLGRTSLSASHRAISSPELVGNVVWKNRSFFPKTLKGVAQLCASNDFGDTVGSACVVLPDQATTGQCTGAPAYWDLGVLGDLNPARQLPPVNISVSGASQSSPGVRNNTSTTSQKLVRVTLASPHNLPSGATAGVAIAGVAGTAAGTYNGTFTVTRTGVNTFTYAPNDNLTSNNAFGNGANATVDFTAAQVTIPSLGIDPNALEPRFSVLTSTSGYAGNGNSAADPQLADLYCNGSRVTPEFPGIMNAWSAKRMQVAATVDEGSNFVNLRYGPLSLSKPADANGGSYVAFGDYHIDRSATAATSSALDHGTPGKVAHDVDNQTRPQGAGWDIGADEFQLPAPVVDLSASALAFGNQPVGTTSAQQTVTVSNSGDAPLTIASISVGTPGSNASQFVLTSDCPIGNPGVAAGGTCTVTVAFAPGSTGAKSATVSIVDNATPSPQTIALSGTGVAPGITLLPASVAFGLQGINTTSAPRIVTITSSGSANLVLASAPAISGPSANRFASTSDCPVGGPGLAPGAFCSVKVTFAPTTTGPFSASIVISDNAAGSPHAVALSGTGAAPGIAVQPAAVAFGNEVVNVPSAAATVTLTNTGNADLVLGNLGFTGANAAEFAVVGGSCASGAVLAQGGSCTVRVSFTPASTGAKAAQLAIPSNASGGASTVALSGNGTQGVVHFQAASNGTLSTLLGVDTLAFTVPRSRASVTSAVSIRNNGTGPITFTSIRVQGAGNGLFRLVSETCSRAPVPVGGTCFLNVQYATPTTVPLAPNLGTATLIDDGQGSPQQLSLQAQ